MAICQPYVPEAATPRARGCDPTWSQVTDEESLSQVGHLIPHTVRPPPPPASPASPTKAAKASKASKASAKQEL